MTRLPTACPKPKRGKRRPQPLKRGTLTRSTKRLKARKIPKGFAHRRDYEYQKWIRALPCCIWVDYHLTPSFTPNGNRIHVAHIKSRGAGGDDHANIVPLCGDHHALQHRIGIAAFEKRFRLNLRTEAEALFRRYQEETGR